MTDHQDNGSPREARPVDLGLSEGKSLAFAPTSALQPSGPPIGGLTPAAAEPSAPSGDGSSSDSSGSPSE